MGWDYFIIVDKHEQSSRVSGFNPGLAKPPFGAN